MGVIAQYKVINIVSLSKNTGGSSFTKKIVEIMRRIVSLSSVYKFRNAAWHSIVTRFYCNLKFKVIYKFYSYETIGIICCTYNTHLSQNAMLLYGNKLLHRNGRV